MSYRIVISPDARAQLDKLYDYIAGAASDEVALRFTGLVLDQIGQLGDFPIRGTARGDILPGLRTIGFRRRITIAFVVEPAAVLVIGIFYGGQDFEAILRDD